MKLLIQRVKHASVTVEGEVLGEIGHGLLVFIGIAQTDTRELADKMVKKLCGLRIFEDEAGRTNLDIHAVNGELLMVSQFTLYADCHHGNRPGFTLAGKPDMAEPMVEYIIGECKKLVPSVQQGRFGADMKVELLNDGPFTIILDSGEIFK